MAKTKSQPLDGTKDIATKRTQLSVKYMVEYVKTKFADDEKIRGEFKKILLDNREEYKGKNDTVIPKYNMKKIRDYFIEHFMPEIEKKKEKEKVDPIDLL